MRSWLLVLAVVVAFTCRALAEEDKKTDDLKPAEPDTGESNVEEETLGLLPNPFEKQGVKFAVTYIGEDLCNSSGGAKQGAAYEDRINFAADVNFEKLCDARGVNFCCGATREDDRPLQALIVRDRGRALRLGSR